MSGELNYKENSMALWNVMTGFKNSILERKSFIKNGEIMTVEIPLETAHFSVLTEDNNPPNIALGIDLYNCEYECKLTFCTNYLQDDMIGDNRWLQYTQDGWEHAGHQMVVVIEDQILFEKFEG